MLDEITAFPKVLVFDLDDTLWGGEVDCTGGPPFAPINHHTVKCSRGRNIKLFEDVPEIFAVVANHPSKMHVAYASRTWEPSWAKEALAAFTLASMDSRRSNMWSVSTAHGWGDCPKTHHFKEIKKTLGIDYREMIFFDNDKSNITEIKKLGAHCAHCPDGLNRDIFLRAIREFDLHNS